MKRTLCVMLTLLLAVSVFFNMGICVNGIDADEKSASEFAEEICKMLENEKTYSDISIASKSRKIENNEFETCRLIVKTAGRLNTLNAVSIVNGFNNIWILQFDSIESTRSAFDYYSKQKHIDYVEADKIISATETGALSLSHNSTEKTYLSWGPEHLGIDRFNQSLINSGKQLANITVAVIDSGIESNHEFLQGRIIPTNINTSGSGEINSSEDDYGHGTQVAGVIVDSTLENVKIKPYKVLDRFGQGTLTSLAAGLNCAINDGVDIINISLGFYESSDLLEESINSAIANDITVVGAAGNSSTDEPYYPSSYKGVIRVAAINDTDNITNFSNYGNITFAAPGIDIKTTYLGNKYSLCKGTSFSAPFCSSVAAAIKSIVPLASAEDIFDIMKTYSICPIYHNSNEELGNGILYAPENFEESLSGKTEAPEINTKSEFIFNDPYISFDSFEIELYCNSSDSTIYYTLDGSVPLEHNPNAKIYNGSPIIVSESCKIYAVAYSEGRYRSAVTGFNATIAKPIPENELVINSDGIITEYKGNSSNISIPKYVNSKAIKGIGDNVFKDKNIKTIVMSTEILTLGNSAFENCFNLETVFARNVESIGENCFKNCVNADFFNFENLKTIGKSSFENVCKNKYEIYGISFFLNLENVDSIPENALKGSAVCDLTCNNLTSIGKNSFSDCEAIVNIKINCKTNLPEGCFKGCSSLNNISISGLKSISTKCFENCSHITNIDLPDVELLMPYSFSGCSSLIGINIPKVISMFSNAFSGCKKLRELILPSFKHFEDTPSGAPLLPNNLETFSAPLIDETISDMFGNSTGIKYIYLNSATDISAYTFRGCNNIFYLNLESVTNLDENALSDCSAEFIDLSKLVKTASLPDNSGIMLSKDFIESTDNAENITLYSTSDSFVERYANYKGYKFAPLPIIVNEIPGYISSSNEIINVSAIGYNLEYQWYRSTENSTENGEPIEGANQSTYIFTEDDTAPFYYCIVTQNDEGTLSQTITNIIIKDTTPADYTEYNKAVEKANRIDKSLYIDTSALEHALSKRIYGRYACEQNIVDEQTKIILDAIDSLEMNVAKKIYIFSSETDLYLFRGIQTIIMILPEDAIYENIQWSSSNNKAFTVNNVGYVRCVGSGKSIITATVQNPDGTTASASIEFEKKLLGFEKVMSYIFRWYYILISKIPVNSPY